MLTNTIVEKCSTPLTTAPRRPYKSLNVIIAISFINPIQPCVCVCACACVCVCGVCVCVYVCVCVWGGGGGGGDFAIFVGMVKYLPNGNFAS